MGVNNTEALPVKLIEPLPLWLQNAFAKGEVFIGHRDAGYSVSMGQAQEGDRGSNSQNTNCCFGFTLHTPERDFVMRADTQDDMEKWILALQKVVELPLTTQDSKCKFIL